MKHLKFLAAVCCMAAVFAACEKNDPSDNTNNNGTNTDQNDGNSNTGSDNATGTANGHDYVDLGLPSGTKWATCNIGATKPEEYGNYYAWGETTTKATYSWNTYTLTTDGGSTFTKYNTTDGKTVLELADDAARANWGGAWRMPTDAEWTELRENCTWTWTTKNGVNGYEVKSNINGNSIFLPAAGYRYDDDLYGAGDDGYYWSSSLSTDDPDDAWFVYFYSDDVGRYGYGRYYGQSVRPVL
ncbi:MAG: hypothetical protein SPE10_01495 [Paludibacteraceae bacterium]|nr:hypothetical protein [Paludibacteraceae bacterium]